MIDHLCRTVDSVDTLSQLLHSLSLSPTSDPGIPSYRLSSSKAFADTGGMKEAQE